MIVEQVKKRSKRAPLTIKIETTNCRHREFNAPILVRDVLAQYPGQAIFALHERSAPLEGSVLLQPGNVYFLSRPPKKQHSSDRLISNPKDKSHEAQKGSRHVSFANTPSYIEPSGSRGEDERVMRQGTTTVEILPAGYKNVTRLKVVLSKHQYEQLLRHGEDAIVETVLNPLLEEFRLRRCVSAPHLPPA